MSCGLIRSQCCPSELFVPHLIITEGKSVFFSSVNIEAVPHLGALHWNIVEDGGLKAASLAERYLQCVRPS